MREFSWVPLLSLLMLSIGSPTPTELVWTGLLRCSSETPVLGRCIKRLQLEMKHWNCHWYYCHCHIGDGRWAWYEHQGPSSGRGWMHRFMVLAVTIPYSWPGWGNYEHWYLLYELDLFFIFLFCSLLDLANAMHEMSIIILSTQDGWIFDMHLAKISWCYSLVWDQQKCWTSSLANPNRILVQVKVSYIRDSLLRWIYSITIL